MGECFKLQSEEEGLGCVFRFFFFDEMTGDMKNLKNEVINLKDEIMKMKAAKDRELGKQAED